MKYLLFSIHFFFSFVILAQGSSACDPVLSGLIGYTECNQVGLPTFYDESPLINLTSQIVTPPAGSSGCTLFPYSSNGVWHRFNLHDSVEIVSHSLISNGVQTPGNYNIEISFFQGSDCSNLSLISCQTIFQQNSGVITYPIASVEGIDPNLDLWIFVSCPDSEQFTDFQHYFIGSKVASNSTCSTTIPVQSGCNLGATPEEWNGPGSIGIICDGGNWSSNENTVYYELYASDTSGSITVNNVVCNDNLNNTNAIQIGVWKDNCTYFDSPNAYSASDLIGCAVGSGEASMTINGLVPFQKYILVIDGYAGSWCSWKVSHTNFFPCHSASSMDTSVTIIGSQFSSNETLANYQWIDCDNGMYIPGATESTFTPTQFGHYSVLLTSDSCFAISDCYSARGTVGRVFADISSDCIMNASDYPLEGILVKIEPGNYTVSTDDSGYYYLPDLPIGNYQAIVDTTNPRWTSLCGVTQSFSVSNIEETTFAPEFGLIDLYSCPDPIVSIYHPGSRRCSEQNIYVRASNESTATASLYSSFVDVHLDSAIQVLGISSGYSYSEISNNIYRVQLGDLGIGEWKMFHFETFISCDIPLGVTLCSEAELFPQSLCVFDSIPSEHILDSTQCELPWDHSSISVDGWCENDSIYFSITNTGEVGGGDMNCYSQVRLYVDGEYVWMDSVQLLGQENIIYVFPGDGRTWRLEVDQHPLHPGNSFPNVTIELCGDSNNWTPNLVNVLPMNDLDPIVDIFCAEVVGSYDPNDKTGYPLGIGTDHIIYPNGNIEYKIRFQNTGTDTAFYVQLLDTLSQNLDISTVKSGVSSHPYQFNIRDQRVLEWRFNPIALTDTATNEQESNGFVTFSVSQKQNLINGTILNNSAAIYFDQNEPVITNTYYHQIGFPEFVGILPISEPNDFAENELVRIWPNPSHGLFRLEFTSHVLESTINIYDITGKEIFKKQTNSPFVDIRLNSPKGIYFVKVSNAQIISVKKIIVE